MVPRNRTLNIGSWIVGLWLIAMAAASCGGGGGTSVGQVSGVVFDTNGNVVRNAKVYLDSNGGVFTYSNSLGSYVLNNVPIGQSIVRAQVVQSGTAYSGSNVAQVYVNQRSKSLNIAVGATTQLAVIQGTVTDRNGNPILNANVFVVGGTVSSSMAVTDARGSYRIDSLLAGQAYSILANATSFDGTTGSVTLNPTEVRTENFSLAPASNPGMPTPQNLAATAWTSPDAGRSQLGSSAVENIKRLIVKNYAKKVKAKSRTTSAGNFIEVDLSWDPIDNQSLLGFGIYRAAGGGSLVSLAFNEDPYSEFFADNDASLKSGRQYSYAITAISTGYPAAPGSESNQTAPVTVATLSDLFTNSVSAGPTFSWRSGSGATSFAVYVFAIYPSLGVDDIWDNASTPTASLSQSYGGPQLTSGQTYYYIVVGSANSGTSETISPVESFVAN